MAKTTMSSRERLLAAITRRGPDHVPCSLHIGQGPWYGSPLRWHDQFERAEQLLELGLDPTIDIWLPDPQPHPEVAIKTRREKRNGETLLTREYHTPAGILRQTVRETADWCDPLHGPWQPTIFGTEKRAEFGVHLFDDWNISRRVEPWVKGAEDLDKLRYLIRVPHGHALDEWRQDAERAIEFARRRELLVQARRTIVGDAFQWLCDIPWFMLQLHDAPAFVEEFLGIFQDWSLELIEAVLDLDVDLVQYRGWYEPPDFWGLEPYRRYLAPLIEAQTHAVHAGGRLHSYLLTEGQAAYAGIFTDMTFDLLHGLDPRPLRGSLQDFFAEVGDRKSFWGGVNAEVTLVSEDPKAIRREVEEAVQILGTNGGFVLSALLFPATPLNAIMCMIQAWKDVCGIRG